LLIGNLLQSQEVTPSSHHSIMRWLLESATYNIRTHQEQYYSARALSQCSTAKLISMIRH
jgi:hypothetical protein